LSREEVIRKEREEKQKLEKAAAKTKNMAYDVSAARNLQTTNQA